MKTIFRIFAMLSFLLMVGTVGGIEHNSIELLPGIALTVVFMVIWVICCKLGGMFYER